MLVRGLQQRVKRQQPLGESITGHYEELQHGRNLPVRPRPPSAQRAQRCSHCVTPANVSTTLFSTRTNPPLITAHHSPQLFCCAARLWTLLRSLFVDSFCGPWVRSAVPADGRAGPPERCAKADCLLLELYIRERCVARMG